MTPGPVAAIVTCRDLGRTLHEALASVERQTRPPTEIVVVDDASQDLYTRQTVARLRLGGTRVVHGEGRGAAAARNLGARLTRAAYLVWLDADDVLEPGYFEAAAARLDEARDLDFVSCAMRAFGAASYAWTPSAPTFVEAIGTGAVPHASTMVRRGLWEAVGGFDESLASFELLDFWATAIERGFRGVVLDEAFLNYRIRAGSGYRRSLEAETYRSRLTHFYRKHREAVAAHGRDLLLRKEAFVLEQRAHGAALDARAGGLEAELVELKRQIDEVSGELAARGRSRVEWGDLRRVQPLSTLWGRDRGTPIDRYYIEQFLAGSRACIRGRVLEVGEALYAASGGGAVERVDILDRDAGNPRATVIADLRESETLPEDTYDCIILTQTLHLVDDMPSVLRTCARALRPGGALLVTSPSVIRVDDRADRDGDFWRLTEASARRLFADVFPLDAFDVETRGNVLACTAFLYGLSVAEIPAPDLDVNDPMFPLVVLVRAVKPRSPAKVWRPPAVRPTASGAAVVLAYHRVAALVPDSHRLCTPPDVFRRHMSIVRDAFTPMALADLVAAAAAGCLPERAVAITLDDGYLDALAAASPVLCELGVPATFFVNSDRIDIEHERDWDVLEGLFLSETPLPARLTIEGPPSRLDAATRTTAERADALDAIHRLMWPLDADGRADLMRAILDWSGVTPAVRVSHRVLTGPEILELASRPGHLVGAHSTHHLALTTQPADTKRREVAGDKATLERVLGQPVTLFSYPYGAFDAELAGIVSDAGFHAAVTVAPGVVRPGSNRLVLSRFEPRPMDPHAFREWLAAPFASP